MKDKTKPAEIDGILVHCAHCELVPVGKIKPYPRNNKRHPDAQLDLLCKAIKAQGWRAPVTVSVQSGYIVRGHARYEAAKRLGLSAVPVDWQNYASDTAERADRIADNRLSELAEWDMDALKNELLELDTGELDMLLTGFDAKAMEDLMTQFHVEDGRDGDKAGASPWDRVGDASSGVMFAFGDIQCRIPLDTFERFKNKCPSSDVPSWVEGVLRLACDVD